MNKQLDKNIILIILLILLIIYSLSRYNNNVLEQFIHDKKILFSSNSNSNINKILNYIAINYFNNEVRLHDLNNPNAVNMDKLKNIDENIMINEINNIRNNLHNLSFEEIHYLLDYAKFYKSIIYMLYKTNNYTDKQKKFKLYLKIIESGIIELNNAIIIKENEIDSKIPDETKDQLLSEFGDAACPLGKYDIDGICCPLENKNINGECCPEDRVLNDSKCCPIGTSNSDGICCPPGKTNIGGICCAPGDHKTGNICCPEGEEDSNGICCPPDKENINGVCHYPWQTQCEIYSDKSKNKTYWKFDNTIVPFDVTNENVISNSFSEDTCKQKCDENKNCNAYLLKPLDANKFNCNLYNLNSYTLNPQSLYKSCILNSGNNSKEYYFESSTKTWDEHSAYAKTIGYDSLACPANEVEFNEIKKIANGKPVWIGGQRTSNKPPVNQTNGPKDSIHWKWIDGTPWNTNGTWISGANIWSSGEPNYLNGKEDNIQMYSNGLFNDLLGSTKMPAIYQRNKMIFDNYGNIRTNLNKTTKIPYTDYDKE